MTDLELADLDDLLGDVADDLAEDRDGDGALDYLDDEDEDDDERHRVPAFDPLDIGPPDFEMPDFAACPFELELAAFMRGAGCSGRRWR